MPGKERRRELARERYERNVQRRVRSRERTRKVSAVAGVVVAIAIIAAGGSLAALKLGAGRPPQGAAANAAASSPGTCTYTKLPKSAPHKYATFVGLPPRKPHLHGSYQATIKTNRGTIVMRLFAKRAPCTVNSFRFLASKGFYDKTHCHRLVTTGIHVLQCGDPSATGKGGPGYSFDDENLEGATYPRGTVAMANSGPDTNGSQFFIVYKKGGLTPKYTPLGRVVKGLDIVDEVAKAGTTHDGVAPRKKLVLEDITVSRER